MMGSAPSSRGPNKLKLVRKLFTLKKIAYIERLPDELLLRIVGELYVLPPFDIFRLPTPCPISKQLDLQGFMMSSKRLYAVTAPVYWQYPDLLSISLPLPRYIHFIKGISLSLSNNPTMDPAVLLTVLSKLTYLRLTPNMSFEPERLAKALESHPTLLHLSVDLDQDWNNVSCIPTCFKGHLTISLHGVTGSSKMLSKALENTSPFPNISSLNLSIIAVRAALPVNLLAALLGKTGARCKLMAFGIVAPGTADGPKFWEPLIDACGSTLEELRFGRAESHIPLYTYTELPGLRRLVIDAGWHNIFPSSRVWYNIPQQLETLEIQKVQIVDVVDIVQLALLHLPNLRYLTLGLGSLESLRWNAGSAHYRLHYLWKIRNLDDLCRARGIATSPASFERTIGRLLFRNYGYGRSYGYDRDQ